MNDTERPPFFKLDKAQAARDLDLPGYVLQQLKGDRKGYWSVRVSGNFRITFRFEDTFDAVESERTITVPSFQIEGSGRFLPLPVKSAQKSAKFVTVNQQ